jgi:ribosomal protein S18 acetylase RimI-like enzyme
VDAKAFEPFWRLDRAGLQDAFAATPTTRFRVAPAAQRGARRARARTGGGGRLDAYAVSGRSDRHGYLQRLAVDPARQRHGIGRALALDGLHWLRRRGAERVVVNTQLHNEAALALYRDIGFRLEPSGLAVLRHELRP